MGNLLIYSLIYIIILCPISINSDAVSDSKTIAKVEKKLSDYVLTILEHFKQKDPVGLPGAPIPDPMDIPPMTHSFSVGRMNMKNVKLYGLKKFRIDHMLVDLAAMQVEVRINIKKLHVFGNYTLSTWLSSSNGPFTVNLTNVFVKGIARLEVERGGHLEAQEMNMDINFKDISMNFERLGFLASVFQGVMNSVGTFVFDSIKPFLLTEVNTNVRKDVNKEVQKIPQKFPNSISPLDQLMAEARRKVRDMGYDPYKVDDYNQTVGLCTIFMTHTWITGLSSFHRVGNITVELQNSTFYINMEVGTQRLEGTSHWEVSLIGMLSRAGKIKFTVEYITVLVVVEQNVDVRKGPILDDIQIELGNIQVRFDGAGTVDYLIEFGVNILPNLLRYQIMDALESPIKSRIQETLDRVNMEQVIHQNLPKLDEQQAKGFQGFL
ncbi:uncharacterized protein LOC108738193 isoform X3 [Agrilus planipennis]|uniref:Uncharacterized protein LOC108738193 isoform X1 n=1 Tax=Agrilus planipennis TaxID=224129 RepID=A0A1W4WSV9_AGRPL|nr:uncharacterized protein LOC108738193 isoform X1 [Agrilus planipennis]XP_025834357.1 uncharacterized protein LOC108738193 isoform X2 [Agrilus planipennis]XP_025834360.1 uncharacterized protein LOC108738193 isoform X3 [Agrilus planipennis]